MLFFSDNLESSRGYNVVPGSFKHVRSLGSLESSRGPHRARARSPGHSPLLTGERQQ